MSVAVSFAASVAASLTASAAVLAFCCGCFVVGGVVGVAVGVAIGVGRWQSCRRCCWWLLLAFAVLPYPRPSGVEALALEPIVSVSFVHAS